MSLYSAANWSVSTSFKAIIEKFCGSLLENIIGFEMNLAPLILLFDGFTEVF